MKFKSNIETQAGIEDSSASAGTAGQLLSSLGPVAGVDGVEWVDQSTVVAAAATLVEIECKNTSGSTITKGTPVYQTGNVGATAVIEIAEADALISANKGPAIGLLQDTLTNNAVGFVVIIGELLNFTTSPIDGVVPTVGDKIFVKSGGGLTTVKPITSLNSIQAIGLVGKVSGGNAGSVTVSSTMRANDVPNLPEGRIWIGDGNTIVSDTVYVDEPNNRVGIGTTSPNSKLQVEGEIDANGGDGYKINGKPWAAESSNNLKLGDWDGEGFTTTIYDDYSAPVVLVGEGKVGIGTTSPSTSLEVSSTGVNGVDISQSASNASQSGRLFFTTNTASEGFALFNSNGTFQVNSGGIPNNTSGTNRISIIGSSGNVGIGTTSPNEKLEVAGSTRITGSVEVGYGNNNTNYIQIGSGRTTDGFAFIDLIGDATYNDYGFRIIRNNIGPNADTDLLHRGTGDLDLKTLEAGDIGFHTTSIQRMIVKSGGDVGIGTTSPSYKLDVNGSLGCTSFKMGNLSMSTAFGSIFINGTTNGNTIFYGAPASFTQNLQVNGTVTCVNLVQTSQTDKKKDISNIDKSKAKTIQFKEYKYKEGDGGRKRYGVLVEDLENDYPELVHVGADGVKGINYIDLLVKRVAELEKELEDISLTPGAKGDTGAAGGDGKDGNSHLSNVTSIAFNPKAGRLEVNISGTVYNFVPSK